MNNKKGISLIVLVITILVMIILAGVVVVTMQDNNPIQKAQQAQKLTSISEVRSAVATRLATLLATSQNLETDFAGYKEGSTAVAQINSVNYYKLATGKDAELGVSTKSPLGEDGYFAVSDKGGCIYVVKTAKIAQDSLGIKDATAKTLSAEGVYPLA